MNQSMNPMRAPRITKVSVNIGVGEGGQRLQLAEKALEMVTGMTPVRTLATSTNRDLGTRKGAPIGCKVTIRDNETINAFLKDAFGFANTRSLHTTSMLLVTCHSELPTTPIFPARNTIQILESSEWMSMWFWKGRGIGFPEGESSPEEFQPAIELGLMNLGPGSQRATT